MTGWSLTVTTRPHDVSDLYLAPVALALDAKIEELAQLNLRQLSDEVALESNSLDVTRKMREEALIRTVAHLITTHHWTLSWHRRGLRLSHDGHAMVLGVPQVFLDYLEGPVSPLPRGTEPRS
jgi:hypothetical protein